MYFDVNLTPIHKRVSWKIHQNYGGRKITIRVRKEGRCKGDVKEIRTRETRRKINTKTIKIILISISHQYKNGFPRKIH